MHLVKGTYKTELISTKLQCFDAVG